MQPSWAESSPGAQQGPSPDREFPCVDVVWDGVEPLTSRWNLGFRVPRASPGSPAPSARSPQLLCSPWFALCPLLPTCLFSQHSSRVLRCFTFSFLLHIYSHIPTAPIFLCPGPVQLIFIENVLPEFFNLFFLYSRPNNSNLNHRQESGQIMLGQL